MTTTKTFTYSHTIGFLTAVGRGFTNPVDLAFNSQGVIYVLNRAGPETTVRLPSKRVSICTLDEEFLGEFGTGGTGGTQKYAVPKSHVQHTATQDSLPTDSVPPGPARHHSCAA